MFRVTGSLQEKNGYFHTVIYVVEDVNGKAVRQKSKWRTTSLPAHGNKRKATEILRERVVGLQQELDSQRVAVFLFPFKPVFCEPYNQ